MLERSHEASISVNVRSLCPSFASVDRRHSSPPHVTFHPGLVLQVSSAAGGICSVEFAVQAKSAKGNQQLGEALLDQPFAHKRGVFYSDLQ